MKNSFSLFAVAVVMVSLSSPVWAQGQGSPGGQGGPGGGSGGGAFSACRQDAQNFCQGVQPGGGRIIDCLEDHYKEISDNCYNMLQKIESRRGSQGGGQNGGPSNGAPNDGPSSDEGH